MAATAMLVGAPACSTYRMARAGREAERHDQVYDAYEYYRSAAESAPTKRMAGALRRTSRPAARYWERQARLAIQRGDRQSAWLCLMRELAIRPDWRRPAKAIAQLESNYAEEVASARNAFQRHGLSAVYQMTCGPADNPTVGVTTKPKPLAQERSPVDSLDVRASGAAEPRHPPEGDTPAEADSPD